MPSSTFNSDQRRPEGPWGWTWCAVLLLVVAIIGMQEAWWRSRGVLQSVSDDVDLWCVARDAACEEGQDVVAVLGASHMQLGFVPDTFRQGNPDYKIANLAINGTFPIPVLRDLAEDESFRGVVICGLIPAGIIRGRDEGLPVDYANYYRGQWSPAKRLERNLRTQLQLTMSWFNEKLSLKNVLRELIRGRLPDADYVHTDANRFKWANYAMVDTDEAQRRMFARVDAAWERDRRDVSDAEILDSVRQIDAWVTRIEERGGAVVFFRPVTSGPFASLEEEQFPRHRFWNVLAENTSALTIHYADVPELAGLVCPDGLHLDHRDAQTATRVLFDEMANHGIVTRRQDDQP